MDIPELNTKFEYSKDRGVLDHWRIIPDAPIMFGDCEDYALSVLYYCLCNGNPILFWYHILFGKAKIVRVLDKNGIGHAVLEWGKTNTPMYIDNHFKRWMSKAEMEAMGHDFSGQRGSYWWFQTLIKIFVGYFISLVKLVFLIPR